MTTALAERSYIALVHHPVYDKNHRVVTTSITNLDIHDIARSSRTYGLAGYYIVHPVAAQRELASRILGHWHDGPGQEQNDFRREALSCVKVVTSVTEAIEQITAANAHKARPWVVATSAQRHQKSITRAELIADCEQQADRPLLLLFGTGWGLTEELLAQTDRLLNPIKGTPDYNHLSVRSAAGIILDRLFAEPEPVSGEHRP